MKVKIQESVPLSKYSTIGIGGTAKYFADVRSINDMVAVIGHCIEENIPYLVIGKGSNVLFDDRGFDGLIILNKIDFFEDNQQGQFHVGAGYSFSRLGAQTARNKWSGLEFASGIPGSVGGAVFMNAGANGTETCEVLESVDYIDKKGVFQCLDKNAIEFSYRYSSFQEWGGAIVGATFKLSSLDSARKKQIDIIEYRTKTQPYGDKSAGCIFRNPEGGHAGQLIEKAGLKGLSVGGAQVSGLHANFIVNSKGATANDVTRLIRAIKEQVKEKMEVDLHDEVRVIPFSKEEK